MDTHARAHSHTPHPTSYKHTPGATPWLWRHTYARAHSQSPTLCSRARANTPGVAPPLGDQFAVLCTELVQNIRQGLDFADQSLHKHTWRWRYVLMVVQGAAGESDSTEVDAWSRRRTVSRVRGRLHPPRCDRSWHSRWRVAPHPPPAAVWSHKTIRIKGCVRECVCVRRPGMGRWHGVVGSRYLLLVVFFVTFRKQVIWSQRPPPPPNP